MAVGPLAPRLLLGRRPRPARAGAVNRLEHRRPPLQPEPAVLLVHGLPAHPQTSAICCQDQPCVAGVADLQLLQRLQQPPQGRHRRQPDGRVPAGRRRRDLRRILMLSTYVDSRPMSTKVDAAGTKNGVPRHVAPRSRSERVIAGSSRPSGGVSTTRPPARSTVGTIARTNGTSASGSSGRGSTSSSPPGPCTTSRTVPTTVPSSSSARRPSSWWTWNSSGSSGGGSDATSTSSRVPRSASAAVRSGDLDEPDQQPPAVRPGRLHGEQAVGARRAARRAARPRARTARPGSRCARRRRARRAGRGPARRRRPAASGAAVPTVGVDDIHPHAPTADAADDGAQRGRGAAAAADHLAEVLGVHPDLEGAAATGGHQLHLHVVRVVDDAPDQMFESVREDASRLGGTAAGILGGVDLLGLRGGLGGGGRVGPSGAGRPSSAAWWPRWWAPRPRRPAPPGSGPACRPSPAAASGCPRCRAGP